ncbi:hypothetical protein M422DRAFT_103304, partial [Sphaerobolus stellatus SS14]
GLQQTPPELVEEVLCFIEDPGDLFSLALCCRWLCALIIPDHLHYRHLRCSPRRNALWTTLLQRPRLASNIR